MPFMDRRATDAGPIYVHAQECETYSGNGEIPAEYRGTSVNVGSVLGRIEQGWRKDLSTEALRTKRCKRSLYERKWNTARAEHFGPGATCFGLSGRNQIEAENALFLGKEQGMRAANARSKAAQSRRSKSKAGRPALVRS